MATIILRDAGSISSPGSTAKGSPLTNLEVDNNFSNINLTTGVLSNLTNLGAGNVANLVVAINEVSSNTGVTASTYGDAAVQTIITVNSKGKITSASNVTSTVANTNITGNIIASQITSVANTQITGNILISQIQPAGATAGTYGGSTAIPVITVDYAGRISNVGNVDVTADGTNAVGFLTLPINSQSASYTTVLADSGKIILHPSSDANARTYTIPANASVAYPVGTALTFVNMTAQVVTIAINTDTMYLSSFGTTGSRSLAQYSSATAVKLTTTTWLISGSGLT
jgi:hypothetical protein